MARRLAQLVCAACLVLVLASLAVLGFSRNEDVVPRLPEVLRNDKTLHTAAFGLLALVLFFVVQPLAASGRVSAWLIGSRRRPPGRALSRVPGSCRAWPAWLEAWWIRSAAASCFVTAGLMLVASVASETVQSLLPVVMLLRACMARDASAYVEDDLEASDSEHHVLWQSGIDSGSVTIELETEPEPYRSAL
ncbi:hypothetical protein HK105_207745 [Polyrhizophydium stewartii]|uniref:Uncharacterized protein n=1 Tax=Polyrhizophydium stewartii TaxID=2732419 RepID=A0ABR4MZV2_9FUNG